MTRHKFNVTSPKIERTMDGIVFDSKAEMRMFQRLKDREFAGEVRMIEVHPKFVLQPAFIHVSTGKKIRPIEYTADFRFFDILQKRVRVVDCKGYKTPEYQLKKKLFDYIMQSKGMYLEENIV